MPLAPAFFKWLIGEEETLGMKDFEKLEPVIFRSLRSILQTPENEIENLEVVGLIMKNIKNKINFSFSHIPEKQRNWSRMARMSKSQRPIASNLLR